MARDVGAWLEGLGLGRYAEAFAENEIDLAALPHITEEDLKEIGVALGARRRLLAAIADLDRPDEPAGQDQGVVEESSGSQAERRHLTVMFCDPVGSTALSERLDPEDLSALNQLWFYRDALDSCLRFALWDRAEGYADSLDAFTSAEPFVWNAFFAARGRALADHGRGKGSSDELRRIGELGRELGFLYSLQAVEAALKV